MDSAIRVNWYNRTASVRPESRGWPINRDVSYVQQNAQSRAGYLNTNRHWDESNNAFTEHFYFTFASRDNGDNNYNPGQVQYYEIGGHRNGRHQHYEEQCCGGGGDGSGIIGAGTFHSSYGGCARHTCGLSKHVFFYYR